MVSNCVTLSLSMRKKLAKLMVEKSHCFERLIAQNLTETDFERLMGDLTNNPEAVRIQQSITSLVKSIGHAEGMVINYRIEIPMVVGVTPDIAALQNNLSKLLTCGGYGAASAYITKFKLGYYIYLPKELKLLITRWCVAIGLNENMLKVEQLDEDDWHVAGLEDFQDAQSYLALYGMH